MVFQNKDQSYLKLALQYINLQNKYSFEFGSLIDKQDHNSFMWTI